MELTKNNLSVELFSATFLSFIHIKNPEDKSVREEIIRFEGEGQKEFPVRNRKYSLINQVTQLYCECNKSKRNVW